MNPRRKVQNFHITVKGHQLVPLPEKNHLFYCYEEENEEHTHIGFQSKEKMSKNEVIEYLKDHMEIECEPQVDVHRSFDTIIGYHYGMGDKEKCEPEPTWIEENFSYKEWVKNKICHKSNNTKSVKVENKILIETDIRELVDDGLVKLKDMLNIHRNKEFYRRLQEDIRKPLPYFLPNTWGKVLPLQIGRKRRHYWIWSRQTDKGKTTNMEHWAKDYRVQVDPNIKGWWDPIHKSTEAIIFDGYQGSSVLQYNEIEKLCDGHFKMDLKYGEPQVLDRKIFIIILCNKPIVETYPNKKEIILARFNEIELL